MKLSTLTLVANTIYKEHYETLKMNHSWEMKGDTLLVEYKWKKDVWNTFKVVAGNQSKEIKAGSEEEFITEHYWGYTQIDKNQTSNQNFKPEARQHSSPNSQINSQINSQVIQKLPIIPKTNKAKIPKPNTFFRLKF